MTAIRACAIDDVPAVAEMFQKTFRDPRRAAPEGLRDCLAELLFGNPHKDPDLGSKVHVGADGRIDGFIGSLAVKMSFRGAPVRAAVPTSLMVDDPRRSPHAAARLVRSFLSGPQDISISEPANYESQALWHRLGGETAVSESMEWLKVFRPAEFAVALAVDRLPALRLAAPAARLIDRGAARLTAADPADLQSSRRSARSVEIDESAFRECLATVEGSYALRPDWEPATLGWRLAHAAGNRSRGPLHRRVVLDRSDRPVGCYMFHARPGRLGWALQLAALPEAADRVVDLLLADAAGAGCAAIKGRTQARLLDALLTRRCLLFRRHTAMIHSRHPDLLKAVRDGEAVTSGLVGEAWMRLVSDTFH